MRKAFLVFLLPLFACLLFACSSRTISSVDVAANSFRSSYAVDEKLSLDGSFVNVTYSSGDAERIQITADMVEGFDTATTGNKTLKVSYKTFSREISYSVYNPEMASRAIRTTARFTLYVDKTDDETIYSIKLAAGDLSEVRAATFTLTSASSLGIASDLGNTTCTSDAENLAFDASLSAGGTALKIVVFDPNGGTLDPNGAFFRIRVNKGENRSVWLSDNMISDGKSDYYLPKTA